MWPEVEQTPGSLSHLSNTTTFQRGKSHTAENEGGKDREPRGLFRCLNKMSFQVHGQNKDHLTFAGHRAATSLDSLSHLFFLVRWNYSQFPRWATVFQPMPWIWAHGFLYLEHSSFFLCFDWFSLAVLQISLKQEHRKACSYPPNHISYFVSRLLCTLTPFHLFIYQSQIYIQ